MKNFEMEAIAQAVAKAVVMAMQELQPDEKQEILLEDYVPIGAVKSYKQEEDYPKYLTIKQAASLLGVPYSKVYELSRSKNTPFSVWGGRKMVEKSDLVQYLRERRGGNLIDNADDGSDYE